MIAAWAQTFTPAPCLKTQLVFPPSIARGALCFCVSPRERDETPVQIQRIKIPQHRGQKRRALAPVHLPETLPRHARRPRHIIQRNPAPPPLALQRPHHPPAPHRHLLFRDPPPRAPLLPPPAPPACIGLRRTPALCGPRVLRRLCLRRLALSGPAGGGGLRSGFGGFMPGIHKGEPTHPHALPKPPGLAPGARMEATRSKPSCPPL